MPNVIDLNQVRFPTPIDHLTMTPTDTRLKLWRHGYDPLPLNFKNPNIRKGWQSGFDLNEKEIELWGTMWPNAINTGILARRTPCLDLDILNHEAAEACEIYLQGCYEERGYFLVRIGLWPKRAIPFRTDEYFKKISLPLIAPDGSEQKIEFLSDGQQFASFGIHPDTGNRYRWSGNSPLESKRDELPYIRQAEAERLVEDLGALTTQFGYSLKNSKKKTSNVKSVGGDDKFDWGEKLDNLIDDDSNTGLALALVKSGMKPGPAVRFMTALVERLVSDADPARKDRRRKKIKSQVESAERFVSEEDNLDETLESVRIDTVKMKAIRWLWRGRFAFGKLGLITGLPDEGKGQLLWYIIGKVTTGGLWPCGEGAAPTGNVIVLEAEDDLHDTVKPRLMAAGADLSRVHFLNMVKTNGKGDKRMFSLVTDLPKLKKKVEEIGDVALIVVDPMSAYLGRTKQVDTFRSTDVRNVLAPFIDLASELNVAIIAIMHFNKKVDVTNVLLRVSDSAAFTAAARHLYGVIDDRPNKRKLFVRGKNNVAAYDQKTLAYRFGLRIVGPDDNGEEIWAPYIEWEPEPVDVTPSEAMQGGEIGRPSTERNKAKDLLKKQLAYGPKLLKDILRTAFAEGISRPTLYRAKDDLQIVAVENPQNGQYRWCLPGQTTQPEGDGE
jgi:hypothetical protein